MFAPQGMPNQQGIDRRRQMADALMKIGQQGTGLSGPWGAIASVLAGGAGGLQQARADQMQGSLDADRKRKIAEALGGFGGDPAAMQALQQLPIEQQQAALGKLAMDKMQPKPQADLKWQDAGNELIGTNPSTGAVVSRITKGVDPALRKTEFKDVGGKFVPVDPYAPNQTELSKSVTPDAKLSSETTRAGQANTAAIAAANRATTERGQDISAATTRATVGNKPLTEFQSKAVGQLTRMQGAEQTLQQLQQSGFGPGYLDKGAAAVPGVGNALSSANYQQYRQAAGEFIAGILRLDSGAAVPEIEFERYFQNYFPQPGDSEQVVTQKAESRQRAMEGLRAGIGQNATGLVPRPDSPDIDPAAQLASNGPLPQVPRVEAPPAALQFLSRDPSPENKAQFKEKFGYLPPGM